MFAVPLVAVELEQRLLAAGSEEQTDTVVVSLMRLVRLLDLPPPPPMPLPVAADADSKLDWLVWRERAIPVPAKPAMEGDGDADADAPTTRVVEPPRRWLELEEKAGALKLAAGFLRLLLQVVSLTTDGLRLPALLLLLPLLEAGAFLAFSSGIFLWYFSVFVFSLRTLQRFLQLVVVGAMNLTY